MNGKNYTYVQQHESIVKTIWVKEARRKITDTVQVSYVKFKGRLN